jgi:hypothetical protein
MIKSFAAAALTLGLFVSAPVAAETLTHQGVTYEYTVTETGATRVIKGYDVTSHRPFSLRVARGRVEGVVDGNTVSFALRDVKPVVAPAAKSEVAAR